VLNYQDCAFSSIKRLADIIAASFAFFREPHPD